MHAHAVGERGSDQKVIQCIILWEPDQSLHMMAIERYFIK